MPELWRMQSTPSSLSLPGPLWPGVAAPDRVISIGQIELNCVRMLSNCLNALISRVCANDPGDRR